MKGPENDAIACSLGDATARERERAWAEVIDAALRARTATPRGVRLEFAPSPDAARALLHLVAGERECCGWARWTLTSTADATVVEASAGDSGPGPDILRTMFGVRP